MKEIKSGNYTIYNEEFYLLFEIRNEAPILASEKEFQICFNQNLKYKADGFIKHGIENLMCKTVKYNEISNSFFVQTKGQYKDLVVSVFEIKSKPNTLFITTKDENSIKWNFINLGENFGKEISFKELDQIWEERRPSDFDFPYPEGLPEKEFITLD